MTLEIIADPARLVEFQPEWSLFARTLSCLTPFQLPEWLVTWWRHFGSGELHVLIFREGSDIVAVIPCFLHEWRGLRQITLIGSGISDYLEPAIATQHSCAVTDRLQSHLLPNTQWDVCNWQDLSCNTPLKRIASTVLEDMPCSEIQLRSTFEEYWKSRPKSLRQNVRRDTRKAESSGSVAFEVSKRANAESIGALIDLHTARWNERGEPGMIQTNHSAGFLEDIAREFATRGMLRIFSLRFEGKIAAVIFGFQYGKRLFNYLTAFDPAHEAFGLGRALLYESIRYCFENGYEAWNFLRGDEPYKMWWGAEKVPKCRVILQRTN